MYHEAWAENPPADWLVAAYLRYKPPTKFAEAVKNTLRMGEMLRAAEALGAMKKADQ